MQESSCDAVTQTPSRVFAVEQKVGAGPSPTRPTPWRLRGGREQALCLLWPLAAADASERLLRLPVGSLHQKARPQGLFCEQAELFGEERSLQRASDKRRRLVAGLCTSALSFTTWGLHCGPPETSAGRQCGPEALLTQDSRGQTMQRHIGLQTVNVQSFSLTEGFCPSFQVEAPRSQWSRGVKPMLGDGGRVRPESATTVCCFTPQAMSSVPCKIEHARCLPGQLKSAQRIYPGNV